MVHLSSGYSLSPRVGATGPGSSDCSLLELTCLIQSEFIWDRAGMLFTRWKRIGAGVYDLEVRCDCNCHLIATKPSLLTLRTAFRRNRNEFGAPYY